jgi:RHS repeat-associated protein
MIGTSEGEILYRPFGATWQDTGTTNVTYKFAGQELDGLGLHDDPARFYEPVLGRFTSPDTLLPDPYRPPLNGIQWFFDQVTPGILDDLSVRGLVGADARAAVNTRS